VTAGPDEALERSFRNLRQVRLGYPGNLSTFDVLYADRVLFTTGALDALTGEVTEARVDEPEAEPVPPSPEVEPGPEPEAGEEGGDEEPA
jgi:hypothetical protein